MKTITTSHAHNYRPGDAITFSVRRSWWLRLWRWITRQRDPVFRVTEVTHTTITMR